MSQSSYDVFLSYARTDDRDIQFVSKLAKEMQRAFQSFTGRQLRIFVDTREIATAEIWQESIKRALENSTVMVAALTPSYFTSEWCGREWDHFRDQEERHRRQIGLPASRSLIFPVQFVSLDKVLDPGNEARRRMSEARSRQIKDLVDVKPESPRFEIAVRELASEIADLFLLLREATSTSASAFHPEVASGPHISTRIGERDKFIERLSEAAHVTLLGIAHGSLTGFLDEASSASVGGRGQEHSGLQSGWCSPARPCYHWSMTTWTRSFRTARRQSECDFSARDVAGARWLRSSSCPIIHVSGRCTSIDT